MKQFLRCFYLCILNFINKAHKSHSFYYFSSCIKQDISVNIFSLYMIDNLQQFRLTQTVIYINYKYTFFIITSRGISY